MSEIDPSKHDCPPFVKVDERPGSRSAPRTTKAVPTSGSDELAVGVGGLHDERELSDLEPSQRERFLTHRGFADRDNNRLSVDV
jgi:hypothetical protein